MKAKDIKAFYKEVCENLGDNYKIVLEPGRKMKEEWIEYDPVEWELEPSLKKFLNGLQEEKKVELEGKILSVYEYICLHYIYDDNVLYFFRKDASDIENVKYIAVDWYARIVDEKWKKNRMPHSRRVCYEFARFFAKAINELRGDSENCEACIVSDKENLHYFVGLTGKNYSLILDLDDFNAIKDLTRLKLGLTLKGIKLFRDDLGKFQKAIDTFNKDRKEEVPEIVEARKELEGGDKIQYFRKVADILRRYKIDAQGFFEYMRFIIEQEGIKIEKIWKRIQGIREKRHVRCIIFKLNTKTYLLDSVDKSLRMVIKEDLDESVYISNPEENEYSYYGG